MERTSKIHFCLFILTTCLQIFVASQKPLPLISDLSYMLIVWENHFLRERDEALADFQHTWFVKERAVWNNKIGEDEKFLLSFLQNFIAGDLARGTEKVTHELQTAIEKNSGEELQKALEKIQQIEQLKFSAIILTQVVSHGKLSNDFPDIWGVSEPSSFTNFQSLQINPEFSEILGNTTLDFSERLSEIKSITIEMIFNLSIAPQPQSVFKIKLMENLQKFYGQLDEVKKHWEKEKVNMTEVKSVSTAVKLVLLFDESEGKLTETIEKMKQENSGSIFENDDFCDLFNDFGDHVLSILRMKGPIFAVYKNNRPARNLIVTSLTQLVEKNGYKELEERRSQTLTFFNQSLVTLNDLLEHLEKSKESFGNPSLKLQLTLNLTQVTSSIKAGLWPLSVKQWLDGDLAGWVSMLDSIISRVAFHVNQGQDTIRLFEMMTKMFDFQEPASFSRFRSDSNTNFTGKLTALTQKYDEIVNITKMWAFPFEKRFFSELRCILGDPTGNFSDTARDVAALAGLLANNVKRISGQVRVDRNSDFGGHSSLWYGQFFCRVTQTPDNLVLMPLFEGEAITVNFTIESSPRYNDALKLRSIGVNFRIEGDPELDKELQEKVSRKFVHLTHSGKSFFRNKGQFCSMETEPMEFYFSMKEHRGEPRVWNMNYKAIQDGDLPLSPYALWEIQFDDGDLDEELVDWTEEFGPELKKANITLELTGDAFYVHNDSF